MSTTQISWRKINGGLNPAWRTLFIIISPFTLFLLFIIFLGPNTPSTIGTQYCSGMFTESGGVPQHYSGQIQPFDCRRSPTAVPVYANSVEGLRFPYIYSLPDLDRADNIMWMVKGKHFFLHPLAGKVQEIFGKVERKDAILVDVGANVGMISFAAAAMGFRVVALEAAFENIQRLCDGVFLNRFENNVTLFHAAASDRNGTITFHKLKGRLDNSAVSATGVNVHVKSGEVVAVDVMSITLDSVIPDSQPVALLKIDVQGWEYHVLKGATKLLSRGVGEAPYIVYEEDEALLAASNSSAKEIRDFLTSVGYNKFTPVDGDAHCEKV